MKVGDISTSPSFFGELVILHRYCSMLKHACTTLSLRADLLVFALSCKAANDTSILLVLYNPKSLFSPFVSENFQRMSQPASQAKPIGTSFYYHPSLVEDGKLRIAFLNFLAARVLEAIFIVPMKCSYVSFGWQDR